jgi:transcriptional regulator with XRE-family HTH domain
MLWKTELGEKIRDARKLAEMSQEELSAEIYARFGYKYTRARISQIEKGISAPAVNIVTAIADILGAEFVIRGCPIGKRVEQKEVTLTVMPQQLCLQFDVEYSFAVSSLKLTPLPENSISLRAVMTRGSSKPIQIIDAG